MIFLAASGCQNLDASKHWRRLNKPTEDYEMLEKVQFSR